MLFGADQNIAVGLEILLVFLTFSTTYSGLVIQNSISVQITPILKITPLLLFWKIWRFEIDQKTENCILRKGSVFFFPWSHFIIHSLTHLGGNKFFFFQPPKKKNIFLFRREKKLPRSGIVQNKETYWKAFVEMFFFLWIFKLQVDYILTQRFKWKHPNIRNLKK